MRDILVPLMATVALESLLAPIMPIRRPMMPSSLKVDLSVVLTSAPDHGRAEESEDRESGQSVLAFHHEMPPSLTILMGTGEWGNGQWGNEAMRQWGHGHGE